MLSCTCVVCVRVFCVCVRVVCTCKCVCAHAPASVCVRLCVMRVERVGACPDHLDVNETRCGQIPLFLTVQTFTRFYPTTVRIIMITGEANWPVCTENVKGISCLESITHVLPGQS